MAVIYVHIFTNHKPVVHFVNKGNDKIIKINSHGIKFDKREPYLH